MYSIAFVLFFRLIGKEFLSLFDALGEQVLYLTVQRTEIVLCPFRQFVKERGGNPQRDLLFLLGHGLIQTSRINYRLGIAVSAEDYQQIGDHCRLALVVKNHGVVCAEPFKCHLDHSHRTVNYHLTGIDYSRGLLALKHYRRYLGSVGKIGYPSLNDLDPRLAYLFLNFVTDSACNRFARPAKTSLVGNAVAGGVNVRGDVVRVYSYDVAERTVALKREVFLVVITLNTAFAVSTTLHITAIPISTGFPRQSFIF